MTDTEGQKKISNANKSFSSDKEENSTSESLRFKRKGVYLLPNLFTTGAMFSGFYAILAGMDGKFDAACIAIFYCNDI